METERKDVGESVQRQASGYDQDKEEGPVSIETIVEDESSFGKAVPTLVPMDDNKPVRESRPTLERVSYSHLSPGLEQSGASWMPRSSEEKEAPREETKKPFAASEGNLCRCGKDHGPAIADMVRSVFGSYGRRGVPVRDPVKLREAIDERDPIKMAEAMYRSLPSVWIGKQTTASNARATKDGDKPNPVSERFGLFGKPAPSGDTEKLDPVEEREPMYANVARYNAKYGFYKEEEEEGDGEKKDQTTEGGGSENEKRVGWCAICGKIHPSKSLHAALQPRFSTLRRETSEKKDDAEEEGKKIVTEERTMTADTEGFFTLKEGTQTAKKDKDEKVTDKDSTPSRATKFLTYDEISAILGRKGHLTDEERGAHIRWKRFRMEQERRISLALKDTKRSATCKGPEQTFEIIAMLTETKRYTKKEEDEPEYFPLWLYYALKDLISTAKNLVVTKNKHEFLRLVRHIESVHPYPPKDDKAAIKILGYAKGAVRIIAGEMALSFLSSK